VSRREYSIRIQVNGLAINKLIIDPHYELKHSGSVSDEIIIELVKKLDGLELGADDVDPPFRYFTSDRMELKGKIYKLVWLLEDRQIYIGVVNAYRR
jgi:hypothetical protein